MKKYLKRFLGKKEKLLNRKDIELIYQSVKNQYINTKTFNIELERIYLKKKLNDSNSINIFNNKFTLIFITIISTIIIERSFTLENELLSIMLIIFFVIAFLILNSIKITQKINERTYYRICLSVLDEIEQL